MGRPLRHPLPHLNDSPQLLQQVQRLVRRKPVLVQQCEDVVDDVVLSLREQVGLRKNSLGNAGTGILAAEFGDGTAGGEGDDALTRKLIWDHWM